MDLKTGKWFVCDYEIKEITPDTEKYHLGTIKVISSKEGSRMRFYEPLTFGGDIEYEGFGKKPYQPEKADGAEWPPHLALARLDTTSINSILSFVSTYGLLGLWLIRDKSFFLKWDNGDYHARSCDYASKIACNIGENKATLNFLEPLSAFITVANEFKSAVQLLIAMKRKQPEKYDGELWHNFSQIVEPYLKQIHPIIARDTTTGLPTTAWNFINLINYCYFRLLQDIQGGTFRPCKFNKCNRPFLAKNAEDTYCSKECRHKGTMANLAIRRVKNDLRDMESTSQINKSLRWDAGKEAQKLYDRGLRDYEELLQKVSVFIEQEKSKEVK